MLKRQPPHEKHHMLPWYIGEYKPKTSIISFEAAREILLFAGKRMIKNRCFERLYNIIACKSYRKHEAVPKNKEMFVYGFKHFKLDKVGICILFSCESDELNQNDKLLNFWSDKFINEELEKGNFKITGWLFMTYVKRNKIFTNRIASN